MTDLLRAAFRSQPVRVESDGFAYVFPHLTAARWLERLAEPGWTRAVMQLADDASFEAFLCRAEDGEAGPDDMHKVARSVLARVAGRPWWEAEKLIAVLDSPLLLGSVLGQGADPESLTLAAFLAVVHAALLRGQDAEGRMKLEAELFAPPPEAVDDLPEDEQMADVVARMRAVPGMRVG